MEEKRKSTRVQSNIIARVRILIPEETFSPYNHEAVIQDISQRGMKLRTTDIDDATYKMLLSSTRLVRVTLTPPGIEKAHTLFGRIVWLDYDNLGRIPVTNYGINFEKITEEDTKTVNLCIKAVTESTHE